MLGRDDVVEIPCKHTHELLVLRRKPHRTSQTRMGIHVRPRNDGVCEGAEGLVGMLSDRADAIDCMVLLCLIYTAGSSVRNNFTSNQFAERVLVVETF